MLHTVNKRLYKQFKMLNQNRQYVKKIAAHLAFKYKKGTQMCTLLLTSSYLLCALQVI